MCKFIVILVTTCVVLNLVYCDQSAENTHEDTMLKIDENQNSVKAKRGIYAYTSGIGLSVPAYGRGYTKYTPYAKFPGIYQNSIGPNYYLSPGSAHSHSINVNYPKLYVLKPVQKSLPVPVYANRFPVFHLQKPAPQIIPTIPHIHTVNPIAFPNILPQSTLISQDGWKPSVPNHIPAVTILPPVGGPPQLPGLTHSQNNYYLPSEPIQQNIGSHGKYFQQLSINNTTFILIFHFLPNAEHQHQQHHLQTHLQHLQQFQEFQNHQNFLRSEQNEGFVTPLSEQGLNYFNIIS